MAYRMSFFLGAASIALAHDLPVQGYGHESVTAKVGSPLMQTSQVTETGSPYPTLSASGTGILPPGGYDSGSMSGASGAVPTGMPTGYPSGIVPPQIEPFPPGFPHGHGPKCLLPHVPDDLDSKDPKHLTPSTEQKLHYQAGDTSAALDYTFHHPGVILGHIDGFKDINCPSNSEITFKIGSHYQQVTKKWPKSGEPLILVDGSDFCGKPGQSTFFNVTSYTADKDTFTGHGKMHSGGDTDIVKGFTLNWQHSGTAGDSSPSSASEAPQVTSPPSAMKNLAKRFGIGDIPGVSQVEGLGSKIETKVGGVVTDIKTKASAVESKGGAIVSKVETGVQGLASKAAGALGVDETISKVITIDSKPTATASSPWGPAKSLGEVDGVTIYCVKCGAHGSLSMGGSIKVDALDVAEGAGDALAGKDIKIGEGSVDIGVKGLEVPMVFGFQAENAKSPHLPLEVQLFSAGLVPFEIPDVFVIGPMLTVDVSFDLQVSATGNLEAGLDFTLEDAEAHLDLADSTKSTNSGWEPKVDKTFNMTDGQLDVNGTFGVPISLGLGINIMGGKFDKNISITDRPAIELDTIVNTKGNQKRQYENRNHARDLLVNRQDDQCSAGIQEIIKLKNDVMLNVFDVWSTDLLPFTTQVFSTCITTGSGSTSGGPAPTGSVGSAPVSGTPANPTAPAGTPPAGASSAPYPSSAPASAPPPTADPAAPAATPAP